MSDGCCCCAGSHDDHKDYVVRLDNIKYDDERILKKAIEQNYGICEAKIDFFSGTLTIQYSPAKISLDEVRQILNAPGFILDVNLKRWVSGIIEKRGETLRLAASAFLIVLTWTMLIVRGQDEYALPDAVYIVVNLLAVLVAGIPTARGTLAAIKERKLNVTVLIAIAAVSALAIGDWLEAASVLFISVIGEFLERFSLRKSHKEVFSVHMIGAKAALVKHEGNIVELPIHKVRKDQILVIKQGMKIPVDGIITDGSGQVNEAAMTGESAFRSKRAGDRIYAGSILESGSLEMKAVNVGSDTTLGQIAKLVEKARTEKTDSEKTVDKFCRFAIPLILGIGAAVFIGNLVFTVPFMEALKRCLVILIVACPCSLVLATPTAVNVGIARAAKAGIIFKNGGIMERMARIKKLLMDKTGTLTYARPKVVDVKTFYDFTPEQVIESAVFVEHNSSHPLAKAVCNLALEHGIEPDTPDTFMEFEGGGAAAIKGDKHIKVGAMWFMEDGREIPEEVNRWLEETQAAGCSSVLVGNKDKLQGGLRIEDEVREDAGDTLAELKKRGVEKLIMVTGDNQRVAEYVGKLLGVDEVQADCMPDTKLKRLKKEQEDGSLVAMVGDGINDSPTLAAADVGISMAAMGSDAAVEAGDISLMNDHISGILWALSDSQLVLKTIKWNIFFAIAVNLVAVTFASVGHINMLTGALLHQASALVVILNSMTLFIRKR